MPDESIEESERRSEVKEDVERRLAALSPEKRWVMRLHYGILGGLEQKGPLTRSDLMRERIRQKLAGAR